MFDGGLGRLVRATWVLAIFSLLWPLAPAVAVAERPAMVDLSCHAVGAWANAETGAVELPAGSLVEIRVRAVGDRTWSGEIAPAELDDLVAVQVVDMKTGARVAASFGEPQEVKSRRTAPALGAAMPDGGEEISWVVRSRGLDLAPGSYRIACAPRPSPKVDATGIRVRGGSELEMVVVADLVKWHINRAVEAAGGGRRREALEHHRAALALRPGDRGIKRLVATSHRLLGEYEAAIALLVQVVDDRRERSAHTVVDELVTAEQELSLTYALNGQPEEGLAVLTRAYPAKAAADLWEQTVAAAERLRAREK